ncbi:MAG: efflux RND transporter periplasmic adaptor subunit [Gammaproteobacteria bacterium]|nr:efflux RND transporter periplasmic adaptor subunit [Gammaproteobacteria bacterium]MBI5615948.1 efflux RND transporter periplasmic adaptor subunit [Gammaproteobacteria bacterium]
MPGPTLFVLIAALLGGMAVHAEDLAAETVAAGPRQARYDAEGRVEAVRQTAIAAQVPARIVELTVKAGDSVTAGQVLVRLDPRAARDQLAASRAQTGAAEAARGASRREYERSKRLFEKHYISQAAMDEAEAQYKAAEAGVQASLAQAGIAGTQTTYATLTAPYAGIVATVDVELGDLATPGRPLLTLYDPGRLRVVAAIPETIADGLDTSAPVHIEVGDAGRTLEPAAVQLLPTADPATHTRELRLELGSGVADLAPGQFARAHLAQRATGSALITIPRRAVVHRPEFDGVYVLAGDGRAQLRQVRLGRGDAERVEVLAGLAAGDRIALEPVAAARR